MSFTLTPKEVISQLMLGCLAGYFALIITAPFSLYAWECFDDYKSALTQNFKTTTVSDGSNQTLQMSDSYNIQEHIVNYCKAKNAPKNIFGAAFWGPPLVVLFPIMVIRTSIVTGSLKFLLGSEGILLLVAFIGVLCAGFLNLAHYTWKKRKQERHPS